MILVRRKLCNKMQLNIQYTVYQLSDPVDKRGESQETDWFMLYGFKLVYGVFHYYVQI